MNGFGRRSTATHPTTGVMVHEARLAVMAVDKTLREGGLAGPADAYQLMGSLSLMTRALQRSSSDLATWLREEAHHRRLTVAEGPFVDDPEAAVRVAAQSLEQASRACRDLFDALERAHIATAYVGAERGPAKWPDPRTRRSRRA